jgi:polysaccharide export outer membrane protein
MPFGLWTVALGFFVWGCGSLPAPQADGSEEHTITDLRVLDLSDKTQVVIEGRKDLDYTFLTLERPPRLVVNLLAMTRGVYGTRITVGKGDVQELKLQDHTNPHRSVRLEILLTRMIEPEIKSKGNRMTIDFPKAGLDDSSQVVKEYHIGPEDELEVMVWKNPELTRKVIVRPDGKISLPLIGDVQAVGLTTAKLKDLIASRLKEYITSPEVSVVVSAVNSYFFYITGEVTRPGKYPLKERTTLLQAISLAGGFTPFAAKNKISVFRKDPNALNEKKFLIQYDEILSSDGGEDNLVLQSGDTIVIP